jgi:integrase
MREKRRGAWELGVFVGRDEAGRVRHRSRMFEGTKRAAARELARLVAEVEDERADDRLLPTGWGRDTTINQAIEGWRRNGWEDLSQNTTNRYDGIWRNYIAESIGRRKIVSLTPYEVESYFRDLKRVGLGPKSIRQIRAVLHRACRLARKWSNGALPNPIEDTEMPDWALHEQPAEERAPTVKELRSILAAADLDEPRLAVFIRVVAASGARRSEICALRWSDVDLAGCRIRIDESIVQSDGTRMVRGPKNRSSVRNLAIDDDTAEALAALHTRCVALASATGMELAHDAFAFSTEPDGSHPASPSAMSHSFARIRDKAGVSKDIHLHSLRHFQSTVLDSVISEAQKQARMGWATVQMARHYTDAISEEDRRAARHVGDLLKH